MNNVLLAMNITENKWKILISEFFCKWIGKSDHILDLGCGYGVLTM